jgi:hypothetical protein
MLTVSVQAHLALGTRVVSRCRSCNVEAFWRLERDDAQQRDFVHETSCFPCRHWRQHHDAVEWTIARPEHRSRVGPVEARLA